MKNDQKAIILFLVVWDIWDILFILGHLCLFSSMYIYTFNKLTRSCWILLNTHTDCNIVKYYDLK